MSRPAEKALLALTARLCSAPLYCIDTKFGIGTRDPVLKRSKIGHAISPLGGAAISTHLSPIILRSSLTNVFTWFLIFKPIFPIKLIKVGDESAKTGSEIISQEILAKLTSNMVQVLGPCSKEVRKMLCHLTASGRSCI